MKQLILHLKREYWEAIKSGTKLTEYREATRYWSKRLERQRYGEIVLLCGYPKRGDESRTIRRKYTGYHLETVTHPHFGNTPTLVFAIDVSQETPHGTDAE